MCKNSSFFAFFSCDCKVRIHVCHTHTHTHTRKQTRRRHCEHLNVDRDMYRRALFASIAQRRCCSAKLVAAAVHSVRWCSSSTAASMGHLSNFSSRELSDAILQDEGLLQRLVEELKARGAAPDSIRESSGSNSSPSPVQATRDGGLPQSVLRATVKIFASSSLANCIMPWQKRQQISVSGSGFVIDVSRRMILTNAHVVQGAQFVEVRKHGDSNNHTGYVVYMGTDCDMALVHVPDDVFWSEKALTALSFDVPQPLSGAETVSDSSNASSPLEELAAMHVRDEAFGGLPQLQDGVKVVGYPVGGDQLSITSGVVSRIEVSSYGRDAPFALLTVQIDAAINHGNSGGPALSTRTKKVIGIAFQVLGNAESIGYIIPLPIVAAFLNGYLTACRQDLTTTTTSGSPVNDFGISSPIPSVAGNAAESPPQSSAISRRDYFPHPPTFGVFYQLLLNKHLREYYGLKPGQTGVLVSGTAFRGPAEEVLKPNDVIVGLNGFSVENDGTIEFRPHERLVFTHMVHVCPPGKAMHLRVLRKRTATTTASIASDSASDLSAAPPAAPAAAIVEELTIALTPRSLHHLVRPNLQTPEFCEKPKYCVFGGLVFSTLTQPLLAEWGDQWFNSAPRWLVEQLSANITAERDEVVVVVQVMPHPVNQSYESMYARIVTQVGGVDVRNFEHFRSLVKTHRDRFTRAGVTSAGVAATQPHQANNIVADESNLILQTRALGDLTKVAVLPIEAAIAADRELEHVYQIPPQRWD
jgi:S1-C subfamily serine protease